MEAYQVTFLKLQEIYQFFGKYRTLSYSQTITKFKWIVSRLEIRKKRQICKLQIVLFEIIFQMNKIFKAQQYNCFKLQSGTHQLVVQDFIQRKGRIEILQKKFKWKLALKVFYKQISLFLHSFVFGSAAQLFCSSLFSIRIYLRSKSFFISKMSLLEQYNLEHYLEGLKKNANNLNPFYCIIFKYYGLLFHILIFIILLTKSLGFIFLLKYEFWFVKMGKLHFF
ncbi:unnamed protein product [Paramecium octaurelia]|uniref:Transmembrane protein n=1 Tax=Paramecium octaurelia TaxID=43137 RepID=A0A8S1THR2_PAROT|nr:unnamed protein product [Paramecium octaurelia]